LAHFVVSYNLSSNPVSYTLSLHDALPIYRGRRCHLRVHRCRVGGGQGHPGPDDGCARPGVSAVWIWPAQRLRNETAPGGHPALRRHTHAPAVVFLSAGVPGIACAHDPVTRTRTSPPIGVNRIVYPPKGR